MRLDNGYELSPEELFKVVDQFTLLAENACSQNWHARKDIEKVIIAINELAATIAFSERREQYEAVGKEEAAAFIVGDRKARIDYLAKREALHEAAR